MVRLASAPQPKPLVVRVAADGRAEAVAYKPMEAQADPLDPTTGFVVDHYPPRRGHGTRGLGAVSRVPDAAGAEHPPTLSRPSRWQPGERILPHNFASGRDYRGGVVRSQPSCVASSRASAAPPAEGTELGA